MEAAPAVAVHAVGGVAAMVVETALGRGGNGGGYSRHGQQAQDHGLHVSLLAGARHGRSGGEGEAHSPRSCERAAIIAPRP